jgi:hypothetical protein
LYFSQIHNVIYTNANCDNVKKTIYGWWQASELAFWVWSICWEGMYVRVDQTVKRHVEGSGSLIFCKKV